MTTTTSNPWSAATGGDAMRVGHAERERAVGMLQDAFSEGRIDKAELDQRIEVALGAKTRADLAAALRGLPLGSTFGPFPEPTLQPRPAASVVVTSLDRSWGMIGHWLGIVTSFIGPAIVLAMKGRTSLYIRRQALEAVNFQLTVGGAYAAIGIVTAVTFGIGSFLFPILGTVSLVLAAVGGLSAATGGDFRYPFTLRLFT